MGTKNSKEEAFFNNLNFNAQPINGNNLNRNYNNINTEGMKKLNERKNNNAPGAGTAGMDEASYNLPHNKDENKNRKPSNSQEANINLHHQHHYGHNPGKSRCVSQQYFPSNEALQQMFGHCNYDLNYHNLIMNPSPAHYNLYNAQMMKHPMAPNMNSMTPPPPPPLPPTYPPKPTYEPNIYEKGAKTPAAGSNWQQPQPPTYEKSERLKPTKSVLLQELLECPICMNRFENPHVLPCQHTFCKSCIVSLKLSSCKKDDNLISCPICRETHKLTNGVEDLPANYTMKRLIELDSMATNSDNKEKDFRTKSEDKLKIDDYEANFGKKTRITSAYYGEKSPQKTYRMSSRHHNNRDAFIYKEVSDNRYSSGLKLILLCHSSALEAETDGEEYALIKDEIFCDEYGTCSKFVKISVQITDCIEKLKKIVEKVFGIPCSEQLLVYKDKMLRTDSKQMYQYRLRNNSRIHIFDKRDVKENINELDLEEAYYVDQDFIKDIAGFSDGSKLQANNTKFIEKGMQEQSPKHTKQQKQNEQFYNKKSYNNKKRVL